MSGDLQVPARAHLQEIVEDAVARQFQDLRGSVREGVREELERFLGEFSSRVHLRRGRPPAKRVSVRSAGSAKSGSTARRFSLDSATSDGTAALQAVATDDGEDNSHEWMFRHVKRFHSIKDCVTDDEYDDDSPGPMGVGRPSLSRRAMHRELSKLRLAEVQEAPPCVEGSEDMAVKSVDADSCVNGYSERPSRDLPVIVSEREPTSPKLHRSKTASDGTHGPRDAWIDTASLPSSEYSGSPDSPRIGFHVHKSKTITQIMGRTRSHYGRSFDARPSLYQRLDQAVIRGVRSTHFDYVVCGLIVVNALVMGAQTHIMAENMLSEVPTAFRWIEYVFCAVFTIEIALRLHVYRWKFFRRHGWEWNVFDCFVVALQLVDILIEGLPKLGFVRMLRIMRLVRAIRLIRILRHIKELRALVASIGASLTSLGWTLVLLVIMIYMLSLCITQLVSDHRLSNLDDDAAGVFEGLRTFYGNLARTMLSLFQAVSGGLNWDVLLTPLTLHISIMLGPLFCFYIAFTILAMLNVVTAIFVESVLETTKKDKNLFMVNNVRELFNEVEGGVRTGEMDWETFQHKLETPPMVEFFKAMDIDRSEANCLFSLLDLDNGGSVDAEEFLSGCLRLQGPAKALDLALLISEVAKIAQQLKPHQ